MCGFSLSRNTVQCLCAWALAAAVLVSAREGRAQQTAGDMATPMVQEAVGAAATPVLNYAAQGWSAADRETFYTTSQGSHLIPYAWFCKGIEKLGIIKRLSRSTARDLPMGYCVVAQRNR